MFKTFQDNTHITLALSSDDHLVTARNQERKNQYFKLLSSQYEVKNVGYPSKYLGWSI